VGVVPVDRPYEASTLDDGDFSVVAVEDCINPEVVLLADELKEEESIWRLWLDAVSPYLVDTAESSAVKSSDVAIAVDHGTETGSVKLDVVL
jgi:hypothetical protein